VEVVAARVGSAPDPGRQEHAGDGLVAVASGELAEEFGDRVVGVGAELEQAERRGSALARSPRHAHPQRRVAPPPALAEERPHLVAEIGEGEVDRGVARPEDGGEP